MKPYINVRFFVKSIKAASEYLKFECYISTLQEHDVMFFTFVYIILEKSFKIKTRSSYFYINLFPTILFAGKMGVSRPLELVKSCRALLPSAIFFTRDGEIFSLLKGEEAPLSFTIIALLSVIHDGFS